MIVAGVPGAPGIAIGPAWLYRATETTADGHRDGPVARDEASARAIVLAAAGQAAEQLDRLAATVRDRGADDEAGILEAQAMMATDPGLVDEAVRLTTTGAPIVEAIRDAAAGFAATLSALDDPILAARAADILDVGERITRNLLGTAIAPPTTPSIAVAADLPPSVAAELPTGLLLAIALESGTPLAHAAILARGLGIPAVVAAAGLLAAVDEAALAGAREAGASEAGGAGTVGGGAPELAVDGDRGEIVVAPTDLERALVAERVATVAARRADAATRRSAPLATADGTRVKLLANIGSTRDVARAIEAGAEGVGLLRTEFLFMERSREPTEDEQAAAYREIFAAFGPDRPVVVRLADIGGDKPLPYLHLPAEANPFLGVRAIRLAYSSPELLITQLRAILRAGAEAGVVPHVMAPMVATLADVRLFDELYAAADAGLAAAATPRAAEVVRGIMVEIPSAAFLAPELARSVSFFSIGTNDLTQYVFAADRTNAGLRDLHDALHPAVLRAIAAVVAGADAAGIPVAVCGELAGDPAGALILVGLGVDELSADANAFDGLRLALAAATSAELRDLAASALVAADAAAVRALAQPLLVRAGLG